MSGAKPPVAVVIPAWNAAATIARAVQSALAQPEVSQVIVVDDHSSDVTANIAAGCGASDRLLVIRQPSNQGPSAARNLAIARVQADFIALLDADDFLLPNRFAPLLTISGWDLIADNIVFIPDFAVDTFDATQVKRFDSTPQRIDLAGFIDGNVSRPGRPRAEMGFAKPLIRRAFIEEHGLRYDESLRLGEDYALYASILARGGVFMRVRRCGYVAVERADSLSGRHASADLAALLAFDRALANSTTLPADARAALDRHIHQLAVKAGHRAFLDTKRAAGLTRAIGAALEDIGTLPAIAKAILRDKLAPRQTAVPTTARELRYLFA